MAYPLYDAVLRVLLDVQAGDGPCTRAEADFFYDLGLACGRYERATGLPQRLTLSIKTEPIEPS